MKSGNTMVAKVVYITSQIGMHCKFWYNNRGNSKKPTEKQLREFQQKALWKLIMDHLKKHFDITKEVTVKTYRKSI